MLQLKYRNLKDFAQRVQVQAFVRKSSYVPGSLKKLATDIVRRYMTGVTFEQAVATYLDLCWTIDKVKVDTIGLNAPIHRSNMLMQAVAMVYCAENLVSLDQVGKLDELAASIQAGDGVETWFYPKIYTFANTARYSLNLDELVSTIMVDPKFGEIALDLVRDASRKAGAQVDDLMTQLIALRKYGVKSSYFQDGMFHQPHQAWVFMDYHDLMEIIPEWREFIPSPPVAFVALSDKESLASIDVEPQYTKHGRGEMTGGHTTFSSYAALTLDTSGEFDLSYGLGIMPVRKYFERQGKEQFYDLLRYAQAIRLYDLVVPIETVAKMPQPLVPKGTLDRLKDVFRKRQLLHPDLIIPRIRSLDNVDELIRELEIEIEKADADTVARSKKELRKHEVVAHTRKLPPGKKATAQAIARAAAYDIVLADNETFVKKHKRGTGEEITGPYRAKARRGT